MSGSLNPLRGEVWNVSFDPSIGAEVQKGKAFDRCKRRRDRKVTAANRCSRYGLEKVVRQLPLVCQDRRQRDKRSVKNIWCRCISGQVTLNKTIRRKTWKHI